MMEGETTTLLEGILLKEKGHPTKELISEQKGEGKAQELTREGEEGWKESLLATPQSKKRKGRKERKIAWATV